MFKKAMLFLLGIGLAIFQLTAGSVNYLLLFLVLLIWLGQSSIGLGVILGLVYDLLSGRPLGITSLVFILIIKLVRWCQGRLSRPQPLIVALMVFFSSRMLSIPVIVKKEIKRIRSQKYEFK